MAHFVISMQSLITKAALLVAVTLPFIETGGSHAGVYIDEEPTYYKSQDIYKAFKISKRMWLHTQNFERSKTGGRNCTYFDIEVINKNGMNYTSHYILKNGTKDKMPYFGKFYKTPTVAHVERNESNGLNVNKTSEPWHPRNFRVVYSDYASCLIFRVTDFERTNGYACMVLVKDPPVNASMPNKCQHMYRHACNGSGISEQIYEDKCRETALPKGRS
uniref:Putative lipocalin-2 1 lipocalin n=1 Tax=Amblyomma americanum TaxID=6943 RepID=A0A0C9S9N4_AMBAM